MKKKILITGYSDYLKPIIKILVNKKINYVKIGIKKSSIKKKFDFDYSNKEKTLNFAKKNKITHIIPDANDVSYLTSSYVANKLKLPGYEQYKTSNLLLNKKLFYIFCKKKKIPIANFFFCTKKELLKKKPKLPFLIKPQKSYSGIGIAKIKKYSDLDNFKDKKYLFTAFRKGQLYSCSCFLDDGHIVKSYFVKEYCINYPYTVDFSKTTNSKNAKFKKKILNQINKLISALKIKSGLIHCQFIKDKDKNYIIEITRRLPGDFYGDLINYTNGNNNYYNYYINNFLKKKFLPKKDTFAKSFRKNCFAFENKRFKNILKNMNIKNIKIIKLKNNLKMKIDLNNLKKNILLGHY